MSVPFIKTALFFALSSFAAAQTTLSGDFDCKSSFSYTLCQNLWGKSAGVGSQSSTLINGTDSSISWSTTWQWSQGQNNVKSYANIAADQAKGIRLSDITSMPTTWNWEYQNAGSDVRADVAYDIWTGVPQVGAPASKDSSYEIMIWLSGKGGVQPIGSKVASGVSLAGHKWDMWMGPNTNWQVISFVSGDGDIQNFSADLKDFFNHIVKNHGVDNSQYLQFTQAGTEPFTGSATLVTSSYSVSLNPGSTPSSTAAPSSSTAAPSPTSSSTTTPPTATPTCKRRRVRRAAGAKKH